MAFRFTTAKGAGLAACMALSLGANAALAAQEPVTAPAEATTQVYDLAYFSQYDLSNAEDMLRRIPGVAALLDSSGGPNQARGLGAGTEQILIDGKRLTSKSTSAAASLRRIAASSVARVELIRGSTDEVRSEGLVVNVVLKDGADLGGVGNFEIVGRFDEDGWWDVDGLVSWSDSIGRLSYVLGFENATWSPVGLDPNSGTSDWSRRFRDERFFYPSGATQELRPQRWRREFERNTFTANGAYDFGGGDSLRLNGLYQNNPVKQTDVTDQSRFSPAGVLTGTATEFRYNKNRADTLELGGELEKKLAAATLKVIGLHTRTHVTQFDFRNRTESSGALVELGRNGFDQRKGEDVIQPSLTLPIAAGQTLTLGGEGAINTLDQTIDVFSDTDRDGRLEQIAIPTAFAQVKERRGEIFVTHSWHVSQRLSVESSLYFEISRFTTNYPEIPVRTVKFLKPRVDIRYSLTDLDRLRLTLNRNVGQLDFSVFVPAYNVVDSRIDLGNPTLKPSSTDTVTAHWEHRLPNDGGTIQGRIFHTRLYNVANGFEPFGFDAAGLPRSRRGNTPLTIFYGGEFNASVRLTPLGLPNAQLTGSFARTDTRAMDLFTLRPRKGLTTWNNEVALGFRHDLTRPRVSYGIDYLDVGGEQLVSDVRQWETFTRGGRVNAFIEKALGGDLSLRFDAYNLNGAHEYRHRTLYSISQLDGTVSRTESFVEVRDRRFALRLRGKF